MSLGLNTLGFVPRGPQRRRADPAKEAEQRAARAVLQEIVTEHNGVVTSAAKALGISAGLVSEMLGPTKKTVGPKTVRAMANLRGVSLDEIVGRSRPRVVYKSERYPNLEKAIERSDLRDDTRGEVLSRVRSIAMHYPTDRTLGEWAEELVDVERSVRRAMKTGDAINGRPLEEVDDTPPAGRA